MTLETLFNSSMATTGKDAHLRFVRIVSLVQADQAALEVVAVLAEAVVGSVEASVPVGASAAVVEVSVEALVVVEVDLVVDLAVAEEPLVVLTPMLHQLLLIHSLIMPLPVLTAARSSMSEM